MALQEELEKQGVWLFRYRGTLPLVILLVGALMYVITRAGAGSFVLSGSPFEVYFDLACLVISLVGLGVRIYTVGHTPPNTSGRNVKEQVAEKLNTTGIYSTVRHPLYLGNFLMWLGPALFTGHFWFVAVFCFFYWVYYERIMFAEEQFLRRKFQDRYTTWAESVPAFIPSLSRFMKPEVSFNWKKVIREEKNGLFATFLVFCLFNVSGELLKGGEDFNRLFLWGAAVTFVLYVVIKYTNKWTSLLDDPEA